MKALLSSFVWFRFASAFIKSVKVSYYNLRKINEMLL